MLKKTVRCNRTIMSNTWYANKCRSLATPIPPPSSPAPLHRSLSTSLLPTPPHLIWLQSRHHSCSECAQATKHNDHWACFSQDGLPRLVPAGQSVSCDKSPPSWTTCDCRVSPLPPTVPHRSDCHPWLFTTCNDEGLAPCVCLWEKWSERAICEAAYSVNKWSLTM